MTADIQELDVVALLRDLPAEQLRAGKTGTFVCVRCNQREKDGFVLIGCIGATRVAVESCWTQS